MPEYSNDKIDDLIWDELVQAKSWEQYITDYVSHKMDYRKYYSIITIILSLVGSTSWAVWSIGGWVFFNYVTPITLLAAGITQILSSIQGKIVIDDKALKDLSRLRTLYIEYYNKLEKLQIAAYEKDMSKSEKEEVYFSIREMIYPIEELKDMLNIEELAKLSKRVYERTNNYLTTRWNHEK